MDFLLEVGCEEIPARFLPPALSDLERLFVNGLKSARLASDISGLVIQSLGTPRRLVLIVKGIADRQTDLDEEIFGPKVQAAYDADGNPTKACLGFARSKGVEVQKLMRFETPKGEVVGIKRFVKGAPAKQVLADVVLGALSKLGFPKSMRWGAGDYLFARPVHWILSLLDGEVLDLEFAGVKSGRTSVGHRFASPESFEVKSPDDYLAQLRERKVIVDPKERLEIVRTDARKLAAEQDGVLISDEGLEEEIAYLTEYPVALLGRFDERFLEVPRSVLIAAMRNHQRYFSIEDKDGKLINSFVAVSNTPVKDPDVVRHGNERVLSARLSDARFFFEVDQKTSPAELVPELQDMLFQADLGSYYEKAVRVAALAVEIAHLLDLGTDRIPRVIEALSVKINELSDAKEKFSWLLARASLLAKSDLLTEMVGEFPELQGEMGGVYAEIAGEDPLIVSAIKDQYRPRFSGDEPPSDDAGAIVSMADRLDTMVGCFGVGLRPTGTADPYALRRACLGVISVVWDRGYHLSLRSLLALAVGELAPKIEEALLKKAQAKAKKLAARKKKEPVLPTSVEPFEKDLVDSVMGFFEGRLRTRLQENAPHDVVDAVLAAGMDDILDVKLRSDALASFAKEHAFGDLAVAFKRVVNIIKDFEGGEVKPELFQHEEEKQLYDVYKTVAPGFQELVSERRYEDAMDLLASRLRAPVDDFFEAVLVNDPDDIPRQTNRKSLLSDIATLFASIADFSRLQTRD